MRRMIQRLLPLIAVLVLAGSPLRASLQGDEVLGADGEVYSVREGSYGELFPGGKAIDPSYPVLALEVTHPDGSRQRHLVEGSEGRDEDHLPFLLYEESSHTVFVLWETRFNVIHPILILSGYDGTWMEPVEIIGNPFAPKTFPQIAVTRDTWQGQGSDGAPTTHHRTVLHLVWREEAASGSTDAFYAPVVFDDGLLVGRSTAFRLSDFDTSTASPAISPGLEHALAINRGRDDRTVVVAFASSPTRRLVTVEIDALATQLSQLADEARMHIIDLGAKSSYPAGYRNVAELARMHIIDLGAKGFQSEVVQAMAQKVSELILENHGTEPLQVIADRARMHIIDLGAKLSDRGLRNGVAASTAQIKEIPGPSPDPPSDQPLQLLNFRLVASWSSPEVGAGPVRYFPARSGKSLLVAWQDGGKVKYRETQGDDWSPTKDIALSPAMDLDRAYRILEARLNQN
jgi:hypothetical protein